MNIKEIRKTTGLSQKKFAEFLNIPCRTIEDWERGKHNPPEYVLELIKFKLNIVQCKDCKRWKENIMYVGICSCEMFHKITEETDFCSYGERME